MFFHKILNTVLYCAILSASSITIASDNFYKDSINLNNGGKIILMSRDGHENDILFPKQENNNDQDEKKEIRIEFNNCGGYKLIYNNSMNASSHDIRVLPIGLNSYIDVSSVKEITETEMHFHYEAFIPMFLPIKKIVFNGVCSKCDDFDLVITNNRDDALGIIFNLSDDSKFGNIQLNNIDSFTVNTKINNHKDYKFIYKKISAIPGSELIILTHNSESTSHIESIESEE